jgi:hypothetical protein
LNTTQQIGGSLGTALLNTIFLSASTAYLLAHGKNSAQAAAVHGFTSAFWVSAGILAAATVVVIVFINADKNSLKAHDDVPVHVG